MLALPLLLLLLLGAYLVGSVPTGFLIARYYGFQDIRQFGSGNIGATNIARALGLHYFFIVLFLDAMKAYAYLSLCRFAEVPGWALLLCAGALLIGNGYSFFLQGSGGKGVATFVGIMLALNPLLFVILGLTWLFALVFLRSVGIASVLTALVCPLYALIFTDLYGFLFLVAVCGWIVWRHRGNIRIYYMAR